MIKLNIKSLRKAIKKITCLNPQVSGIHLAVSEDCVKVYYADGHCTLVDTIEATADTTENLIVNAIEIDRALAVCQPGHGIEVDALIITPDTEKRILNLDTTKHLKVNSVDGDKDYEIAVHQSIPYRGIGDSIKDNLLIKEDYSKLWSVESFDLWDKAELISYLKEMICAGGKTIIYSTQRNLMFTQSLRYVLLQRVPNEDNKFGMMLSTQRAKALTEVLQQMNCDTVQVSNTIAQGDSVTRLIFTDTDGKEGCSCETATITAQLLKSLEYYNGLSKSDVSFTVNKRLLQEAIDGILMKRLEQCSAEINNQNILTLKDSTIKNGDTCEVYINDATSQMEGRKFLINVKSLQTIMQYFIGTDVTFTLIDSKDTEQLNSYLRVEGTDEKSAVMYCMTSTK